MIHNCPKCGKPMVEQSDWKGMWMCPDYVPAGPVNTAPPFKCTGAEMTEEGAEAFCDALAEAYLAQIARNN